MIMILNVLIDFDCIFITRIEQNIGSSCNVMSKFYTNDPTVVLELFILLVLQPVLCLIHEIHCN